MLGNMSSVAWVGNGRNEAVMKDPCSSPLPKRSLFLRVGGPTTD